MEKNTKIILDGFGGDNSPNSVVEGAKLALDKHNDLSIIITGDENQINQVIGDYSRERLSVINTTEVITNDDVPTDAIRKKENSSMVVALKMLSEDDSIDACISAGSTGALLTGAFMKVGRIKGVSRPALAPSLPTITGGQVVLVDCGANVDCKAVHLLHFAMMGDSYAKAVCGVANPRIALLSNGTEEHKGNALNCEAFELLKTSGLNFVGNIEARDVISGDYDVVVSDGFAGNIALKSIEGVASGIFTMLKQAINESGLKGKLGALLLKDALRSIKHKMDYNRVGGASFLGVKKPVIKAHGSSSAVAICSAIEQGINMVKGNIIGLISEYLVKE